MADGSYDITVKHPLYLAFEESWQTMRDCMDGEDEIKDRGERYLPMKSGMRAITDTHIRAKAYEAYKHRAEFPELLSPTVRGSTGLAHDQPAQIELPPEMEYLLEDATLDGTTLADFHMRITTEVLTAGRYGVLPGVDESGRFYLTGYQAEKIINWDTRGRVLTYAVLDESAPYRDPATNTWSTRQVHLELLLDENNAYIARRWLAGTAPEELPPALTPRQEALTALPFVFVNTADLLPDPDDVPLYGLAKIALRIYRLDADYMQGLHMTAEPTPWVNGFTDPVEAVENGSAPSTIGAARIWILPPDATAGFLEFTGPGLAAQSGAISAALERAVMFGAQVLSENTRAAESGESRRLRLRSQQSLLKMVAINSASGLERALRNIAVWMGLDPTKVTVKPFLDFTDYTLSAQDLTALVAGWQSGAYSKQTLFENLQRADMIPAERTFEDEQELIDADPALGVTGGNGSADSQNNGSDASGGADQNGASGSGGVSGGGNGSS